MRGNIVEEFRQAVYADLTLHMLRALIIAWAISIIALAIMIDNRWILAGLLAWEVLP